MDDPVATTNTTNNTDSNNLLDIGISLTDNNSGQIQETQSNDLLGGILGTDSGTTNTNMMGQSNNLLDQNIGMPSNNFAGVGPQTQYSLDGMMGGVGAPSAGNLLD